MLFLYRPRETWMPFSSPRNRTQQGSYNRQLQRQFDSTRRVEAPTPQGAGPSPAEAREQLAALRDAGVLTNAEYEAAVARIGTG